MKLLLVVAVLCLLVAAMPKPSVLVQKWTGYSTLVAVENVGIVVCWRGAPCDTEANQPILGVITLRG